MQIQDLSLFDSMRTGIYVMDSEGNYIYANAAFLKSSGGQAEDIPKLNAFKLVEQNYCKVSAAEIAFREKRKVTLVNVVDNQKGMKYPQLITANPVFDSEGNIEYMVAEILNINETLSTLAAADFVEGSIADGDDDERDFIAVSKEMKTLLAVAENVAKVESTVLLTGETGVGKDVMAHYIHAHSARKDGPFVQINMAALPENLLEAELFGYEKGSFTGANKEGKEGLIQSANNGILFLDEINSAPLALQGKLLQALETGMVRKIGSLKEEPVNFRVIAATNRDLQKCVDAGTFREDLYYRLSVVPLHIPPLRERREDIVPLILHFLERYTARYNRVKILSVEVMNEMRYYEWPGNIRELENVTERLIVINQNNIIGRNTISMVLGIQDTLQPDQSENEFDLKASTIAFEKRIIEKALDKFQTKRKAAAALGIDHSTLVKKCQRYHIE